jgi:hypothetical protein
MSASKNRREAILEALFTSGRTWEECKRIYAVLALKKSQTGKATLKMNGKEYEV